MALLPERLYVDERQDNKKIKAQIIRKIGINQGGFIRNPRN